MVESDRGGFIRIAHPLTPDTRVTRNGTAVVAIPDVESLTVMPLLPGANNIVLTWVPSTLRQLCFWTSVGMWCLLLAAGLVMRVSAKKLRLVTTGP